MGKGRGGGPYVADEDAGDAASRGRIIVSFWVFGGVGDGRLYRACNRSLWPSLDASPPLRLRLWLVTLYWCASTLPSGPRPK